MLKKNDTNLKKKNVFFKTVVGTFCAICAVTSYPCFHLVFNYGALMDSMMDSSFQIDEKFTKFAYWVPDR